MAKLTKRLVETSLASGNDSFIWDNEISGFGVRIYRSGKRSYLIQYRVGKRTRRFTIGPHGIWTVETARKEAKILLGRVAHGVDPVAEKICASTTVSDLCDHYLANGMVTAKDSSIRQARANIENHIKPLIGLIFVTKLSRGGIQKMMQDIALGKTAKITKLGPRRLSRIRGGKGTANRVITTLCAALTFAVDHDLRSDNPALKIKKFPGKKFDRFLSPAELSRLGTTLTAAEALGIESPYALAALRLLILTGCRKNEILSLRRNWIDTHYRCLRLPDSKTGAKVVQLGSPAIQLIGRIKPIEGNPYLLAGRRPGTHLGDLTSVWRRIRASAGLEDVRIHDLRHSFASMGASSGDSLLVIGALLGHRSAKTTQRYAHLADDPVRSAADRIAISIASCLDPANNFEHQTCSVLLETSPSPQQDDRQQIIDPVIGRAIRTKWLDTRAAAAFLGNTVGTLQTYRWMGIGPRFSKIGRRIVYDIKSLTAWQGTTA